MSVPYPDTKLFINGKWRVASSNNWLNVTNPATEEVVGKVSVAEFNDLDEALETEENVEQYFLKAWKIFKQTDQLTVFAKLFGLRVFEKNLSQKSKKIAADLLLLTNNFKLTGSYWSSNDIRFGLITDDFSKVTALNETERTILKVFSDPSVPFLVEQKLNQGKLGEVILNSLLQFETGIEGNLKDFSESLSTLNLIGLGTTARRAALTHLVIGK